MLAFQILTMVSSVLTSACVNLRLGLLTKSMLFKLVVYSRELCPENLMNFVFLSPGQAATRKKLGNLIYLHWFSLCWCYSLHFLFSLLSRLYRSLFYLMWLYWRCLKLTIAFGFVLKQTPSALVQVILLREHDQHQRENEIQYSKVWICGAQVNYTLMHDTCIHYSDFCVAAGSVHWMVCPR